VRGSFVKSDRIYVAGHTGMVGSAIYRALARSGYDNILVRTHDALDLKDQAAVDAFFRTESPDYVIAAAAKVGGIKANSEFPADFLMENIGIQHNLFNASYKSGVKKFIFLSSSCMYPRDAAMPLREDCILSDHPEPTNEPYALAKIVGTKACGYYNAQYGTRYIALVPANAYGVNDHFDPENAHVIPAMIRKFNDAKALGQSNVTFWGTGTPLREFLYVDDLADAVVFVMAHDMDEDIINVGGGTEISIRDLAEAIKSAVGYEGEICWDSGKPDGMMRRVVDSSILDHYGWRATTDIRAGIERTITWFNNRQGDH